MTTRIDVVPDDKKARYWGEERNERRRARYQSDAEYRQKARQQTRETYRRLRLAMGGTVREDDCSANIPLLDSIGTVRMVRYKNDVRKPMLTLTVEELAKAIGRNQQVIYRWFAADMFPRPTVMAETERNRNQLVYTKAETIAAMREFARHQLESQYYRERHVETRDRIFEAVEQQRATLASNGVAV